MSVGRRCVKLFSLRTRDLIANCILSVSVTPNNGDISLTALVGLEVEGELGIIAFDDHLRTLEVNLSVTASLQGADSSYLLHGLGTNSTHTGGFRGCRRGCGRVLVWLH